ncbi:MAG: SufE family protein [Bacteroidota bacterium]
MTIREIQENIVKEFEDYIDWDDRYKHIIELGRSLPALDDSIRTDKYKLAGCQSQAWINAKLQDGKVFFEADSDAAIVKGLIAILIRVYSGATPDEIIYNPPFFLSKIGIDKHLSPTRKNGLAAMMKQIQMYAVAFKSLTDKSVKDKQA